MHKMHYCTPVARTLCTTVWKMLLIYYEAKTLIEGFQGSIPDAHDDDDDDDHDDYDDDDNDDIIMETRLCLILK